MGYYLGLDTSCYMTSAAVVDDEERLVCAVRRPLRVEAGALGLRQSEAVFQHVKNLPTAVSEVTRAVQEDAERVAAARGRAGLGGRITAVGASTRPRAVPGSYMPVFAAGESFGRSLATALGVPFHASDHQSGHLIAGAWSAGLQPRDETLAVHLSGGTTELLRLRWSDRPSPGAGVEAVILGATTDLAAGQFIDRAGLALGLDFPAGPHLEHLADSLECATDQDSQAGSAGIVIPSAVRGYDMSFSGPSSAAERLVRKGVSGPQVARAVLVCVANTLEKVVRAAVLETGIRRVLIVGGVAANRFLRERLRTRLGHRAVAASLYFGAAEFSGDNAAGVALAAARLRGARIGGNGELRDE